MGNEASKKQLMEAFDRDVREMQNPDKRNLVKKKRLEKSKKVAKRYGM